MLTRVGAAARLPTLSVEQFQQHWRERHGPTAGAIPNLVRYVQHHAVVVDGRTLLPYPGFDACSELDFESLEAMDDGFAKAAQAGDLRADEDRFVDKARYSWVLGEVEVRAPSVAAADPVTLVTWWRTHPAARADRLRATLCAEWEAALPPLCERRLIAARHDWHAGRQPPTADVVEVITFDGLAAARGFLDGAAHEAGPLLAGIAFGAERHLARPIVIV
jgi:uncharacterized protein (TIGR02118 family)